MSKKVSDLIIDKFSESIDKNSLFAGISEELTGMIKKREHAKEKIENLLRKKQNENP
jgi:chemotaxis methyl-accepting protein methylase